MTLNFDSVEQMQDALAVMLTGRNQPTFVVSPTPIQDTAVSVPTKAERVAKKPATGAAAATTTAPVTAEVKTDPKPESAAATPAVSATATAAPAAEPAPAEPAAASPSEPAPAPSITLEEVRAKLAELSQAGKSTQVKAILTAAGFAKLTDIPTEQYPAILEKAAAL